MTIKEDIVGEIRRIEEKFDEISVYNENLKQLFSENFNAPCMIQVDNENKVNITLHFADLTEANVKQLNELCDTYTIEAQDTNVIAVKLFSFKGMNDE